MALWANYLFASFFQCFFVGNLMTDRIDWRSPLEIKFGAVAGHATYTHLHKTIMYFQYFVTLQLKFYFSAVRKATQLSQLNIFVYNIITLYKQFDHLIMPLEFLFDLIFKCLKWLK